MDSTEPPPVVIESPAPAAPPPAVVESPALATPPPVLVEAPVPAAPPPVATASVAQLPPELPPPGARTLELGAGAFMLTGVGSSGVFGLSPFVTEGLSEAVFLRFSVGVGRSPQSVMRMTWAAGRVDACLEVPGQYAARNGLQLDLCGGFDVGVTYIASGALPLTPHEGQTLPYVNVGPSVDLRGDLGTNAAVTLRGVLGLNVARARFTDAAGSRVDSPIGSARVELNFSWRVH